MIEGIWVKDMENILGQYADDMDVYLYATKGSITAFFSILDWFKSISGFSVNYDKTVIYRMGSLRNTSVKLYTREKVKWTNEAIKVLGVVVSDDVGQALKQNYDGYIDTIKGILQGWKWMKLSLFGKIVIINTLIRSLFVYKMMVLPAIPDRIISQIDKLVQTFLWNDGVPKIAKEILKAGKDCGGANLMDLKAKDESLKSHGSLC